MKTCSKCRTEKELSEFNKCKKTKDGRQAYCKICTTEYDKKYRAKNKDKTAVRKRKYRTENKEKIAVYGKKYREENKDKISACIKLYRVKNKNHIQKYNKSPARRMSNKLHARTHRKNNKKEYDVYRKAYAEKNRERINTNSRRRHKRNPDKRRARDSNRRTRVAGGGGKFTALEFKELCNYYGNACLCCGLKRKLTADHVVPVFYQGSSDISNIQPLCRECNSSKGVKEIDYR